MSSRGPLVWTRLHLSVPVTPDAARDAVQALAGLAGQPRLVLEAQGRGGRVSWRLGADREVAPRVLAAMSPHLPGFRSEAVSPRAVIPRQGASVYLPGHRRVPLATERVEPITRSLLAALASARGTESVRLQLILGPRRRPRRIAEVEPRQRREAIAKFGEYRFGCTLRLDASAATSQRTRRLIDGLASALRGLEVPGVRLQLRRVWPASIAAARSPLTWPLELGVTEVVAVAGWPLANKSEPALPGVPAPHPALLPVGQSVPMHGRVLGTSAVDDHRRVAVTTTDSLRHLHILGPTGVGKSTLIGRLALQDIEAGGGVVVIDPKGDLVEDLLTRIPKHRLDDIVVLDPRDSAPVGIQALGTRGQEADLAADTMLGVFHSLYADSWGPRTHDILHACLLTLARRGDASLVMVPMLLTNPGFRRSVVGQVVKADPLGLGSFWAWFESISDAERTQAIAPLMNKLRPVLLRPGLRAVFGQRAPRFQMADVFTKRRILLVSLSKGTLGAEASRLLGSVVVALLWQAALGRTAVPAANRHSVMVHIDEVQEYLRLPGDLGDALAQARGLEVGFTLAHQHLAQLPPGLREAVLANARSRVAFQLSARDARDLAKTTAGLLSAEDFQTLPAFHAYASLLVDGATKPWCSITTQPLPASLVSSREIRERSRALYGQALNAIERDLLGLIDGDDPTHESLGRVPRRSVGGHA